MQKSVEFMHKLTELLRKSIATDSISFILYAHWVSSALTPFSLIAKFFEPRFWLLFVDKNKIF